MAGVTTVKQADSKLKRKENLHRAAEKKPKIGPDFFRQKKRRKGGEGRVTRGRIRGEHLHLLAKMAAQGNSRRN